MNSNMYAGLTNNTLTVFQGTSSLGTFNNVKYCASDTTDWENRLYMLLSDSVLEIDNYSPTILSNSFRMSSDYVANGS